MTVKIREAVAADLETCRQLLDELSNATGAERGTACDAAFAQLVGEPGGGTRGRVIIAEENAEESGEVVVLGMAAVSYNVALRYNGEYCQLEELVVRPAARGKNVGGLLVQRTIDDAKARGCAEYGLYLIPTTEHNRPFYEKYGFEALGTEMRQSLL